LYAVPEFFKSALAHYIRALVSCQLLPKF
jgi:hypothetical protein